MTLIKYVIQILACIRAPFMKYTHTKFSFILLSVILCSQAINAMSTLNLPELVLQNKRTSLKSRGLAGALYPIGDTLFKLCRSGTAQELHAVLLASARFDAPKFNYERHEWPQDYTMMFLEEAVLYGNLEVIQELGRRGASLDDPKLLRWAALGCHVDLMSYLIQQRTNFPSSHSEEESLLYSLVYGYKDMKIKFLEQNYNKRQLFDEVAGQLKKDLHSCLTVLITAGLNVNTKDKQGKTSLHKIAFRDRQGGAVVDQEIFEYSADAVEELITVGADVNGQDNEGNSPLHCALEQTNSDTKSLSCKCVEVLLNAGAQVALLNNKKQTALDILNGGPGCPYNDQYATPRLLLKSGCIFNRLPEFYKWHYSFNEGKRGLVSNDPYAQQLQKDIFLENLLYIAPICYGIFLPTEAELSASRARLGAVFLHLTRYHAELGQEPSDRFDGLLSQHLRAEILLADPFVSAQAEAQGKCSYRKDLLNIYLDHLRWGNPVQNHYFEMAKEDLVDYLVTKLLTFCTSSLNRYQTPSTTKNDLSSLHFKEKLKAAVTKGLDERLQGLKRFGSSLSPQSLSSIRQMLASIYPASTPAWKERFLRVHALTLAHSIQKG